MPCNVVSPKLCQITCLQMRAHMPVLIALLLGLGLVLRTWQLPLMLYDFDEGVASIYALQMTQRGDFPLVGVRTSLGFYNPPLFIYLISPAFLLSTSPVVATGWLQLMWLAAFAFLSWQLYRYGWGWGLLTVLLFASLSPGPLLLSRRLWGHSLIPTCSAAVAGMLLLLWLRPRCRRASFCLPLLLSAAQQVHFSGALLTVGFLSCLMWLRLSLNVRCFAAGVAAAALTYAPYLHHQSQNDFADFRTIWSILTEGAPGKAEHTALWNAALHTFSDMGGATVFQQQYDHFLEKISSFLILKWALALTWCVLLIWSIWTLLSGAARRRTPDPVLAIGLTWTTIPLIVFSFLQVVTVPAYWLVALPGPLLLLGSAVEAFCRHVAAKLVLSGALMLTATGFLWYFAAYQAEIIRADPSVIVYPSYRDQLEAVQYVSRSAGPEGAHLVQEGRGTAAGIDYQLLYLIAMVENGYSTRLRKPAETAHQWPQYVIHSRARKLPPQLVGRKPVRFGMLEVFPPPP